ncbi:MAG: hypothetical protein GXO16_03655 [Epsilonproteobacteria bacterium]|nr:hypothetical protein [Campylobacterota bacterium]
MRRQAIVDSIKNRLKTITKENGYDWEPKVFEWLVTPLGPNDLPAIVVKDTEDEIDSKRDGFFSVHRLSVEILIFAKGGDDLAQRMRKMAQDVLGVIGANPVEGEDVGDFLEFVSNDLVIEQQHDREGGMRIEIAVLYNTEKWSL